MKKIFLGMAMLALQMNAAMAQVTPHGWRGPEHNGYYPDKALLEKWAEKGPELVFETTDAGKGSIIAADGKLFIYDERRGYVGLVKANPAKFDVVSKFRIEKGSGPYWAHMSIDKGILYVRHGELLAAYKIN